MSVKNTTKDTDQETLMVYCSWALCISGSNNVGMGTFKNPWMNAQIFLQAKCSLPINSERLSSIGIGHLGGGQ